DRARRPSAGRSLAPVARGPGRLWLDPAAAGQPAARAAGNHVPRARPGAPRERGGDIVPASHPQPAARQRPAHRAAGGGGLALPGRAPAGGATAGTRGGDGVLRDHPPARTPAFACRAKGPGGGARGSGGAVPARGAAGVLIQPPRDASASQKVLDRGHVVALTSRSRTSAGTRVAFMASAHTT